MAIDIVDVDAVKVEQISKIKNEPKWMTDFRIKSFKKFLELSNPNYMLGLIFLFFLCLNISKILLKTNIIFV